MNKSILHTWTERDGSYQYHLSTMTVNLSSAGESWHVSMSFVEYEQTLIVCPMPKTGVEEAKRDALIICKQFLSRYAQEFQEVL